MPMPPNHLYPPPLAHTILRLIHKVHKVHLSRRSPADGVHSPNTNPFPHHNKYASLNHNLYPTYTSPRETGTEAPSVFSHQGEELGLPVTGKASTENPLEITPREIHALLGSPGDSVIEVVAVFEPAWVLRFGRSGKGHLEIIHNAPGQTSALLPFADAVARGMHGTTPLGTNLVEDDLSVYMLPLEEAEDHGLPASRDRTDIGVTQP